VGKISHKNPNFERRQSYEEIDTCVGDVIDFGSYFWR
jgi:hypothetical protein